MIDIRMISNHTTSEVTRVTRLICKPDISPNESPMRLRQHGTLLREAFILPEAQPTCEFRRRTGTVRTA